LKDCFIKKRDLNERIIILDFGSQYTQLIARKIRELNVYCEIHPFSNVPDIDNTVKGIVLSGSPFSVRDKKAPMPDMEKIKGKLPLLGICYGAQVIAHSLGGEVLPSKIREYGRANLQYIDRDSGLLNDLSDNTQVWMSHGDTISKIPSGFKIIGSTGDVKVAAYKSLSEKIYGIQFHPEVYHTTEGKTILYNFVVNICNCTQNWTPLLFIESKIAELRQHIGDDKVVLGLSGGVDSTVTAVLLNKAVGKNLTCIFVENGLLRKNEYEQVLASYRHMGLNVIGINAGSRFISSLKGVIEPERKRKIIGKLFIDIFEKEARKIRDVKWLAQGTIYPDVIESVSVKGPSVTIKSHHNVGGLPSKMNLKVIEPLKLLFKDEVRKVGITLNIDKDIINRHPYPGPGLAIRIIGEVTSEKIKILQEVDHIFVEGLKEYGLYDKVWQAAAVLLPVQSVGVMGDERTYENVIALRAVSSTDGMTADWTHLPFDFLGKISNRIINNIKGINRVVYDISSKPPATIEWE
jgi:GMP synthase (glutamine-hydrolysing)